MTFLAPAFMVAAGLVAGGVFLVHFIVTREPRPAPLPTARFAPLRPVRARARRLRLQDIILMLLRVLAILAVGAGLAKPVFDPPPRDLARIIMVDRSRAVADAGEVADSVRSIYRDGDVLVFFGASAVAIERAGLDSLAETTWSDERGRLSPALIAALRAASSLRERADSLELALVSPLAEEEFDRATDSIRALWPAAIRHLPVALRADTTASSGKAFAGAADDPLRYALTDLREAADTGKVGVLLVRHAPSAADSAWAAAGVRTLVHWPATHDLDENVSTAPYGWALASPPDTVGGVSGGDVVVVAPFERWAHYEPWPPELGGAAPQGTQLNIAARWADGSPAAVEVSHGEGCIRTVTLGVPMLGDLVLQPRFSRLAEALAGPCTAQIPPVAADSTRHAMLTGSDSKPPYVAGSALPVPELVRTPLVPWLFAAALLFALGALLLQRRVGRKSESLDLVEAV